MSILNNVRGDFIWIFAPKIAEIDFWISWAKWACYRFLIIWIFLPKSNFRRNLTFWILAPKMLWVILKFDIWSNNKLVESFWGFSNTESDARFSLLLFEFLRQNNRTANFRRKYNFYLSFCPLRVRRKRFIVQLDLHFYNLSQASKALSKKGISDYLFNAVFEFLQTSSSSSVLQRSILLP